MEKITTKLQLENIVEYLNSNGFGHLSSYEMNNRKIEIIIRNANTLNIDNFDSQDLSKEFTGDYADFENTCKDFFSSFSKDDKLDELLYNRLPVMKSKDGSKYGSKRLWKVHDKHITFQAYYDSYTTNKLMLLLGYEGSIDYISEYNPKELTGNFIDTLGNVINYQTFKNGNIKLTGNVTEINDRIKQLLEKKNIENIAKGYDPENRRIID